jgi:hypothetical protein
LRVEPCSAVKLVPRTCFSKSRARSPTSSLSLAYRSLSGVKATHTVSAWCSADHGSAVGPATAASAAAAVAACGVKGGKGSPSNALGRRCTRDMGYLPRFLNLSEEMTLRTIASHSVLKGPKNGL